MKPGRLAAILLSTAFAIGAFAKDEKSSAAHPVNTPQPEYPAQLLAEGAGGTVEIEIQVDRNGAVSDAKVRAASDQRFEATCVNAARRWSFQPAKYFGKAIPSTVQVTFHFEDGKVVIMKEPGALENGVPPQALKMVEPTYPAELMSSGNIGRVTIAFIVDSHGVVREPKVLKATHPAFEAPAIEALLKWKFAPGAIDGRPVNTKVIQEIVFTFTLPGGVESYAVELNKRKKSDTPEELRFDSPPKPKTTVFAMHPYDDAIGNIEGSAEVKFLVGPEGNVLATEVVKASKPEFGLALAAAMEAWTFDPALRDGKRVISLVNHKFEFETGERDSAVDEETARLATRIRKGKFTPAKPKELDAPLRPKFVAPPVYPTALIEKRAGGSAVIEVIVDEKGRAVLPRIIEASEPQFGWAAATAAQRWLFDPPKMKGKPVEVKVEIPFRFVPPEPEPEEEMPAK